MAMKYLDKYPKNLAKSPWVLKPCWAVMKLFAKTVTHRSMTILYLTRRSGSPITIADAPD